MVYRMDPVRAARKRLDTLLTKGHFYALVDKRDRKVVMSANNERPLRMFSHFRTDLELVKVKDMLDELPLPLPDSRIKPH